MATDTRRAHHVDGTRRAATRPAPTRPPERAQLVWRRALELARPGARSDPFENALDLLRTAHHDPATMAHALTLGRTRVRADAGDVDARAAADILDAAIAFLGVKPTPGDVARPARHR